MGNLVSDVMALHGSFPFVSALLKNQCQAALEAQV